MTREPLAVSADGDTVVCGDGPELLVYDGAGTPRFKHFLEDVIVGVGAGPDRVIAALSDGRILQWHPTGGTMDGLEIPGVSGMTVSPEGVVACVTRKGVALLDGAQRGLPFTDVRALAFGADRGTLGVLTGKVLPPPPVHDPKAPPLPPPPPGASGFAVVDTASGAVRGSMALSGNPSGVGWIGSGGWVVGHGAAVSVYSADGRSLRHTWSEGQPVGAVAGTPDGVACAAVVGNEVVIWETHTFKCAGRIQISRPVTGLAFGPGGKLIVGMDDADLTLVDLFTGQIGRSEPHHGRGRNNWGVKRELDAGVVRGALVKQRAGRVAVARYVGPIDDPDYDRRWWQSCLLAMAITFMMIFGCAGLSLFTWILYLKGWIPFL